jgi:hypothetical protein
VRRTARIAIGVLVALLAIAVARRLVNSGRPAPSVAPGSVVPGGWNVLANPIDPAQQTDLPFGLRSHWLQPWRAYLDTPSASLLRNAVGINFNVPPRDAMAAADLLAVSGFKRARVEIGWGEMSYANPSQLADPAAVDAILGALKAAGIRPLILLNANDHDPSPSLTFTGNITQPAAAGSRTVDVGPLTARALVPGLSGFDVRGGRAAAFIVTSVSPSGQVQLARPLPVAVPAGLYPVRLLRDGPFAPPLTSSGQPNPRFEQTLRGWLQYVKAVTSEARRVLGNDHFDVEIWNELTFGSAFLSAANYYDPVPPDLQGTGSVASELLARTVQWIRNPANGLPDVGIGDGFANETPFVSGATVPPGVTAIDKHPYHEMPYHYPADQAFNNQRPVDGLGHPEGSQDASGNWHDSFIPTYEAYFPEYLLTGIQTDFLERDLSPLTTSIGGVPHGRSVVISNTPARPQVWITETNIDLTHTTGLTPMDLRHLQAKATLRTLAAYVNKGVSALYFYAFANGTWAMVDPTAPGGGATMTAVRSFLKAFAGPATITPRRSLKLLQIADRGNWIQFRGHGTAAYPPLYNRDVVGFFPFQTDTNKFVIPAYVMTRDLATLYDSRAPATDVTRYDLPPEVYRLTVGGLNAKNLRVSASDPLTGATVPVTARATSESTATLGLALTDYPRLITIQDG